MKRFLNWLGRSQGTRPTSGNRRRTFRPHLEELDSRLVPSALSSAISIQHNGWVERDWYTIDNRGSLVEFQGTSRRDLDSPGVITLFVNRAVSASVDPNTGSGEAFVIDYGEFQMTTAIDMVDSSGHWHNIAKHVSVTCISATRDGHVYACINNGLGFFGISYFDSYGNRTDLGAPISVKGDSDCLAASVGWFGGNEVFAIGGDGAIYVNRSNSYGDWQIVDNQARFVSLSATSNDTVFAVTTDGRLFQETEHFTSVGWLGTLYWTAQDISGGQQWAQISADTDASGHDEVYSIEQTSNTLFLYDQGSRTLQDYGIQDISAAAGGCFYEVSTSGYAWQFNPNAYPVWTYLGSNFQ